MSALDYPVLDAHAQLDVDAYKAAAQAERQKQIQAELLLRRQAAEDARQEAAAKIQAQQEARAAEQAGTKNRFALGLGDVMSNILPDKFPTNADPAYQTGNPIRAPFAKTPSDYQQRMISAYGPENLPAIAEQHDAAVQKITGAIPGLEGMERSGAVLKNGEVTSTYIPKVEPVNEQQEQIAQAIAEGKANPATAFGRGSKDREKIMARAVELGYDVKSAEAQKASLRDMTSGVASRQRKSLNQVISHLGGLADLHASLGNTGSKPVNIAGNWFKQGGDTTAAPLNAFKIKSAAVAEEIAKLMSGTGVSDKATREEWRARFSPDAGPQELSDAITAALELMSGASTALQNQRDTAYQDPRLGPLLDEESKSVLRKFNFAPSRIDPVEAAAQAASTTAPVLPPAGKEPTGQVPTLTDKSQFDALPSGAIYIRDGKQYRKP